MGRRKRLKYHIANAQLQFSRWRRGLDLVGCTSEPAGERRQTLGLMESGCLKESYRRNIEILLLICCVQNGLSVPDSGQS